MKMSQEKPSIFRRAQRRLAKAYRASFLFRMGHARRVRVYGVGAPKSGTHSVASICRTGLRVEHEPDSRRTISKILDYMEGRIDEDAMRRYVRERDRKLWLEVDSSEFNIYLLDALVDLFPDARFILTIRDPHSWLDSLINHTLWHGFIKLEHRLYDHKYQARRYTHPPEEAPLKERGLYTLDGYLSAWTWHNRKALDTIPEDRLMVVRTDRITERAAEIAAYAGIPGGHQLEEKAHAFPAKERFDVLSELDQDYLHSKIVEHCGELIAEYFPERQPPMDLASTY